MEIIETFFRKDRFYVRIQNGNGIKTLPRANFIWIQGNPSFREIPKGYVIHHLDSDKSNDDISNLVIMQKFHHAAYHWKQKTFITTVINDRATDTYCPVRKPSIYKRKKEGVYAVYFRERVEDSMEIDARRMIYADENGSFKTLEAAEAFAKKIWPHDGSFSLSKTAPK